MKKIKFASRLDFIELPKPAIKYLPDWYKKTPPEITKGAIKSEDLRTFKHCVPFLDSMTSGYIFELWQDVEVKQSNDGRPYIYWKKVDSEIFSSKPEGSAGMMDTPYGYSKEVLSFHHNLFIKTPPGYSVIITQPFNRTDLPFYALSGVVDTDKYPLFPGLYPMFLRKGFEGIIERGTPMLQIIPFKRDDWKSENSKELEKEGSLAGRIASTFMSFWYKRNAWVKKSYE